MYYMNNDFFDSFSVLFSKEESILNEKRRPLGSYAADALDMDLSLLEEIRDRVALFQEVLTVFLSARDASSAAEAQQALNELWTCLEQMPAYSQIKLNGLSTRRLIAYMRAHPAEVEDMLTLGTERSAMLRRWQNKLSAFGSSFRDFVRESTWMLENYFEDLPSRRPDAYAVAYDRYRFDVSGELRIRQEENEETGDLSEIDIPKLSFRTQLSFVPVHLPGKKAPVLAEKFIFDNLTDFLFTDLYRGMAVGNIPRKCHNCGRWFLAVGGYDTLYCDRVAPGETKRTCRKVGAHNKEQLKNSKDFAQREYSRVYNRLKARKRTGMITTDEWNRLVANAQELKDKAKRGDISETELKGIYDKI